MKLNTKYISICMLLGAFAGGVAALAQDGPPKVLYIVREVTKPGKGGALHEKTESAFVNVMAAAKVTDYYFALTSISGPDRALFLSGYDSFEDMAKARKETAKIPGLAAAMDRVNVADGELLSETAESAWMFHADHSMNTGPLKGMRLMEISKYIVKPGHAGQWDELVKMVKSAYAKSIPTASWAMFDEAYGQDGDAHLIIWPLKSMKEIDQNFAAGKQFMEALGPDGMKKLESLMAASVESAQTNLFTINPKMSYPEPGWIAAEPDFWKPKMAPVKKAVAKPVQ